MENTVLAIGATGECVDRLTALLGATGLGIASQGKVLDAAMMETVEKAQQILGVSEPAQLENVPVVKGQLVGPETWHALEEAAAFKLGLVPAAPAEKSATEPPPPPPPAGDGERPATAAEQAIAEAAGAGQDAPGDTEEQPPDPSGRFAESQR